MRKVSTFLLLQLLFTFTILANVLDYDSVRKADRPSHAWEFTESTLRVKDEVGILDFAPNREIISNRLSTSTNNISLKTTNAYDWPGGDLTIEFFIKAERYSSATYRSILSTNGASKSGGWGISVRGGAGLRLNYYEGGSSRSADFSMLVPQNNLNHHIVLRISGNIATMALDGSRQDVVLTGPPAGAFNQEIRTASHSTEHQIQYSQLTIYHYPLTDERITQHYRAAQSIDSTAELYASASGDRKNPGTETRPLDLISAFTRSLLIGNGGTVNLAGGVQHIPPSGIVSTLTSAAGKPILIKGHPVNRTVFDGSKVPLGGTAYSQKTSPDLITDKSQWVVYQSFDITNSNPDAETGRARHRGDGLQLNGSNTEWVDIWIYDTGSAVFKNASAKNSKIDGGLFFNCGWWSLTSNQDKVLSNGQRNPAGHAIYAQHDDPSNPSTISNTVLTGCASNGLQAFGTKTTVSGLIIDGVIAYRAGGWISKKNSTDSGSKDFAFLALKTNTDNIIRNSILFGARMSLGRIGDPHRRFMIHNNFLFDSSLQLVDIMGIDFGGNLIIDARPRKTTGASGIRYCVYIRPKSYSSDPAHEYNSINKGGFKNTSGKPNTYAGFGYTLNSDIWNEHGVQDYTFPEWTALTGIDGDAVIRNLTTNPFVRPIVQYRPLAKLPDRGFIAVYNPTMADRVTINLAEFALSKGQQYQIYDVLNPGGSYFLKGSPVVTGSYNPNSSFVSVSMTGTIVREPIGIKTEEDSSRRTSKKFKTFILRPGPLAPKNTKDY